MKSKLMYLTCCVALSTVLCPTVVNASGEVVVDQKTRRFVSGESRLNRDKYFTFHTLFRKNDSDFKKFKKEYNLNPDYMGSRIFNSPMAKHDYGDFYPVKRKHKGVREVSNFVSTGHPHHIFWDKERDYAEEPLTEEFINNAVTRAADYFRYEADEVPFIFEPMNEPMIKAVGFYPEGREENKYIRPKLKSINEQIATVYREAARKIHSTPELVNMKVAGFSSAYPEFESHNFVHWNNRFKKFIDIAGADMDYYAIHLYDGVGVNNKGGRRSGSNVEAILDIIDTYSHIKLGETKPFAITEYGRLVPDQPNFAKRPMGNFVPVVNTQAVRSQLHMLMNFIERGGDVVLSTPFTLGKIKPRFKYSKSSLWIETKKGKYELTPRRFFFEAWKDVSGDRVRVNTTNIDVQTQAFVDGKELYLVLNNLNDNNQTVALNIGDTKGLKSVHVKRIRIPADDTPKLLEEMLSKAPKSIDLEYGETIVLTYKFSDAIKFDNEIHSTKHYAKEYLQPIKSGKTNRFTVPAVKTGHGEALLRIGLGRDHGSSLTPEVKLNGKKVAIKGDVIRGYDQANRTRFFGLLEIPVGMDLLKEGDNTVEVTFGDNGGHVTSVIIQSELAEKAL